eukprot:1684479-Amphidinium_carterae.1
MASFDEALAREVDSNGMKSSRGERQNPLAKPFCRCCCASRQQLLRQSLCTVGNRMSVQRVGAISCHAGFGTQASKSNASAATPLVRKANHCC